MKEENKNTFQRALRELPEEAPTVDLWTKIDGQLKQEVLQETLQALPTLTVPLAFEELKPKVRYNTKYFWLTIAAAIFIISFIFIYPQNQTTFYQEQAQVLEVPKSFTDDSYQEFLIYCQQEKWLCENDSFQELKTEFEDLKSAQEMLKEGVATYGPNIQMLQELNDLERKKAEILNKMAEYI